MTDDTNGIPYRCYDAVDENGRWRCNLEGFHCRPEGLSWHNCRLIVNQSGGDVFYRHLSEIENKADKGNEIDQFEGLFNLEKTLHTLQTLNKVW